jgi:thiol-disulfide isomerase/thioredoxin
VNATNTTEADNGNHHSFLRAAKVISLVILALSIGGFIIMKQPALAQNDIETVPTLDDEGSMPELSGAIGWINSAPLDRRSLHGKVVLVDFWTYTCINSLRPLPYVKHWAEKYKGAGLVVIGVHTPEFSFEKEPVNVANAVHDLQVTYPVAIDSDHRIWDAFQNEYWPAQYLIDGEGKIRYHHFGEGDYGKMERVIQELLKENGAANVDVRIADISAGGVEAAPDSDVESSETYIGYARAEHFASPGRVAEDSPKEYKLPASLSLNHWGLEGSWNVGGESAVLQTAPGKVAFRFHSRDLHLVLSPSKNGRPIRFKVTLDGAAPGDNCGSDCGPDGAGEVREPRLYQLIRQKGQREDHTFEIEFLDPGVRALDFTFG